MCGPPHELASSRDANRDMKGRRFTAVRVRKLFHPSGAHGVAAAYAVGARFHVLPGRELGGQSGDSRFASRRCGFDSRSISSGFAKPVLLQTGVAPCDDDRMQDTAPIGIAAPSSARVVPSGAADAVKGSGACAMDRATSDRRSALPLTIAIASRPSRQGPLLFDFADRVRKGARSFRLETRKAGGSRARPGCPAPGVCIY